jgi:hypothetical protein
MTTLYIITFVAVFVAINYGFICARRICATVKK